MAVEKCNREKLAVNCACTYSCPTRGKCCECVASHKARGEFPGCLFPPEGERTYDRSFRSLAKYYKK
ncbi:MAG: hypothetical protein E3J72_18290 [Planctomycetota bacterium]|nr:MAG: hypothetical protein E3J72_18290 [Planctomycetota bacterium]